MPHHETPIPGNGKVLRRAGKRWVEMGSKRRWEAKRREGNKEKWGRRERRGEKLG